MRASSGRAGFGGQKREPLTSGVPRAGKGGAQQAVRPCGEKRGVHGSCVENVEQNEEDEDVGQKKRGPELKRISKDDGEEKEGAESARIGKSERCVRMRNIGEEGGGRFPSRGKVEEHNLTYVPHRRCPHCIKGRGRDSDHMKAVEESSIATQEMRRAPRAP